MARMMQKAFRLYHPRMDLAKNRVSIPLSLVEKGIGQGHELEEHQVETYGFVKSVESH